MREGIMLCYPYDNKRFIKWGNKAFIQPKLDGERCRCIIDSEGTVSLRSSQNNEITAVPHITEAIGGHGFKDIEFDGELYVHGIPFEDIHSIVSRKVNLHSNYKVIEYHIFDIIKSVSQERRAEYLYQKVASVSKIFNPIGPIRLVETQLVTNEDSIERFYDYCLTKGYEGFILRNMNALYERRRSINIMKFKPTKRDAYEIVGYVEEYTQDGVPKSALGALVLTSGEEETFAVGTGFTEEQRYRLWQERESLKGNICVVQFQQLTNARGVPRFPVFVNIEGA